MDGGGRSDLQPPFVSDHPPTWSTLSPPLTGAAAIHIEDQVFPKKCGFFEGKQVIPVDDHVNKIRAALDARTDPDFVIITRCDAYAVTGWEDTMRRSRAYIEAGADVVFVDGIKSEEDIRNYARDMVDLPRM